MYDLELARFGFGALSGALLLVMLAQPRRPIFILALAVGLGRLIFANPNKGSDEAELAAINTYIYWDIPTTALRVLACFEAFIRRTEDFTRRLSIFSLCALGATLTTLYVDEVSVDATELAWLNKSAMLAFNFGGTFLATLLIFLSFSRLGVAYRGDHAHVVLLMLFCLVQSFHDAIPQPTEEDWVKVSAISTWVCNALLLGWLVVFGDPRGVKHFLQRPHGKL